MRDRKSFSASILLVRLTKMLTVIPWRGEIGTGHEKTLLGLSQQREPRRVLIFITSASERVEDRGAREEFVPV